MQKQWTMSYVSGIAILCATFSSHAADENKDMLLDTVDMQGTNIGHAEMCGVPAALIAKAKANYARKLITMARTLHKVDVSQKEIDAHIDEGRKAFIDSAKSTGTPITKAGCEPVRELLEQQAAEK